MMNKIVALVLMAIGFGQVSFAQNHFNDSIKAYNYWAKRGAIEAVFAYMQDYQEVKTLNSKEQLGKNEFENKFISNIEDYDITTINKKFDSISSFLINPKYDWKNCEKTIFQPMKKHIDTSSDLEVKKLFELTRNDNNQQDIPLYFIADTNKENINKSEHWDITKSRIIQGYQNSLNEINKEADEPIPDNTSAQLGQTPQEEITERNEDQIPWDKIIWYGSFFIIGVFFGGWMIFLITKSKIKSIVNRGDEKKYKHYLKAENDSRYLFGYLRVVSFLQKRKDNYKYENESFNKSKGSKNESLERMISQLEKEKKELLNENIELGNKLSQKTAHNNEGETKTYSDKSGGFSSQPQTKKSKIYFSMPESDGSFQLSNGEPSNDGKKYFKIEFEESSTKGELFYLSGDRDQRAINRLDSYLKPVCEIENITNSSTATKIELIQSGKVTQFNDSWIIDPDNKVKIKLY